MSHPSSISVHQVQVWHATKLFEWLVRLGKLDASARQPERDTMVNDLVACLSHAEGKYSVESFSKAHATAVQRALQGGHSGLKIIFLDVDGVLNIPELSHANSCTLYKCAMHLLVRLVKKTGAYIVLSTTWRLCALRKFCLIEGLARAGLHRSRIIGQTPDIAQFQRTTEICAWLDAVEPSPRSWVALDDLDLASSDPELMTGHFVWVDPSFALSEMHTDSAARLLGCDVQDTRRVRCTIM